MNKLTIAVLVLIFFSLQAKSQTKTCTYANTKALDKLSADNSLNNWDKVYKTYQLYAQCDDGMYAELFSDSTVRLLATNWKQIERLNILTAKDKQFHEFVIRHINSTAAADELGKIIVSTKNKCSNKSMKLCKEIGLAAETALGEFNR